MTIRQIIALVVGSAFFVGPFVATWFSLNYNERKRK
jgi:hypothetical protein